MTTMNRPQPGDPAWLVEALKLDGTKEIPGKEHSPEVVKMFADAGHPGVKDDETAWCAALVGAALRRAGYVSTGTLLARDYLKLGQVVKSPKRGDIVIFPRGNSTWQGHVAFVVAADADYIYAFGGNQNNQVNVTRYSRAKALGFRRPVALIIVMDVQERLHALGYGKTVGEIDGVLGPKTKAGIASYEAAKGYAPFDSITTLLNHLKAAQPAPKAAAPYREPEPEDAIAPPPAKRGFPWWIIVLIIVLCGLGAFGIDWT